VTVNITPRPRARRGQGQALRGEILAAARDLLERTGAEDAVSIRAVAAEVGVSTPSIYLHFDDKTALIDAVCELVFAELDEAMVAAAADIVDPLESLRQFGLGYVRFAISHPEQYRIVMMSRGSHAAPGWQEEQGAFIHLSDLVARCQAEGVFDNAMPTSRIAVALWAAAHGVAALCISKPALVELVGVELLAGDVITAIGAGVAGLHPGGAPSCG
jgi:AcrR family transcriptional regulator